MFAALSHPPLSFSAAVVSGLGGDSEHTWSKNGIFWPRDLLPREDIFRLTTIYSFGYDSNFKKSSILNVEDFSNALVHGILHNPSIQANKVGVHNNLKSKQIATNKSLSLP